VEVEPQLADLEPHRAFLDKANGVEDEKSLVLACIEINEKIGAQVVRTPNLCRKLSIPTRK